MLLKDTMKIWQQIFFYFSESLDEEI